MGYQWVSRLAARHDVTLLTMRQQDKPHPAEQIPNARVVEWTDAKLFARNARLNSLLKPGYVPLPRRPALDPGGAGERGERFDVRPSAAAGRDALPLPRHRARDPVPDRAGGRQPREPARLRGRHRALVHALARPRPAAHAARSAPAPQLRARRLRAGHRSLRRGVPRRPEPAPGRDHERDRARRPAHARRAAGLGRHRAPAVRRAARALEGAARRDPRAGAPHELRAGRARRGRRGLRPGGLPGAGRRARPRGPGHLPRLAATRARGGLLPPGRRVRVPELSRARGQRDLRGDGLRAAADRHRPRRPRATSSTTRAGSACIPTIPSSSPTTSPPPSAGSSTTRSLRARLGAAARERVGEIAVWDRKVELLEALWDDVLGPAHAA